MKPLVGEMLRLAVFGSIVVSVLLKVTVIMALVLVATRLARRSPASVRHTLLASAFLLLLVLPLASVFAPTVRLLVPIELQQETLQSSFLAHEESFPANGNGSIHFPPVLTQPFALSTRELILAVWLVGATLFMLPVVAGLWQTRSLRRSGISWHDCKSIADQLSREAGIRRRVEVLLHEGVPGPMTSGILHPVIILPFDARYWKSEELKRALLHELEHVRRGDWISRCIARALCAAYWFHPLVWVTWRQFVLEAERACDDAVLNRCDATVYADQLVELARRLSTDRSQPILAMANRYDLSKRVSALLDTHQKRGPAGILWVTMACLISAVLATAISPLHIAARLQSPAQPADGRKFEVATVRPCKDEDFRVGDQRRTETSVSPGRITVNCVPLNRIIYFAYAGIGSMDNPLVNGSAGDTTIVRGGPGWIRTETYYIEAKAEGTAERGVMMGPMLRALLEERFKLKTHRELEEVPMYALSVAKAGLKIKPLGEGGCRSFESVQSLSREEILASLSSMPVCGGFTSLGDQFKRTWILGGTTLERFATDILSRTLDRHVMNTTGVDGTFNIRLEFGYDDSIRQGVFGGRPVGPLPELPPDVEPAPSIFTALEQQLGLKLEKTNGPKGFVVIDSVERLSPQ